MECRTYLRTKKNIETTIETHFWFSVLFTYSDTARYVTFKDGRCIIRKRLIEDIVGFGTIWLVLVPYLYVNIFHSYLFLLDSAVQYGTVRFPIPSVGGWFVHIISNSTNCVFYYRTIYPKNAIFFFETQFPIVSLKKK